MKIDPLEGVSWIETGKNATVIFNKCHCDVTMTHSIDTMTLEYVEGNKPRTDTLFELLKLDH